MLNNDLKKNVATPLLGFILTEFTTRFQDRVDRFLFGLIPAVAVGMQACEGDFIELFWKGEIHTPMSLKSELREYLTNRVKVKHTL